MRISSKVPYSKNEEGWHFEPHVTALPYIATIVEVAVMAVRYRLMLSKQLEVVHGVLTRDNVFWLLLAAISLRSHWLSTSHPWVIKSMLKALLPQVMQVLRQQVFRQT